MTDSSIVHSDPEKKEYPITGKNPLPVKLESAYTTLVDEASSDICYVGEAEVGSLSGSAVWRIKKIETSGSLTTIKFANGDTGFTSVWDDRATLTYS